MVFITITKIVGEHENLAFDMLVKHDSIRSIEYTISGTFIKRGVTTTYRYIYPQNKNFPSYVFNGLIVGADQEISSSILDQSIRYSITYTSYSIESKH